MDCREEVALLERRFKQPAGRRGLLRRRHGAAAPREVRRRASCRPRRSPMPSPTPACAPGSSTRSRSPATPPAERERRSLVWVSGRRSGRAVWFWRRAAPAPAAAGASVRRVDRARRTLAVGRRAWHSVRARVARHQRADAHRRRRRRRSSASGPRPPPSSSCSPSRRRSKRGRSSARGTRSAR